MGEFFIKMIKLILAILILPFVIVCAIGFQEHLANYPEIYKKFFLWGMGAFLLSFLFIHQLWTMYEFGQKITSGIFKFLSPLDRFFSNIVPFYLVIVIAGFYITKNFFNLDSYDHYFIFFTGFTFCMHVLITAQDLQEKEKTFVKPDYFFMMSIIFILNIFLIIALLDLVVGRLTFPVFFKSLIKESEHMYFFTLKKIFLM